MAAQFSVKCSIFEELSWHFPVVTLARGYPELRMNVPVVLLLLFQPFLFNKLYIILSFWWLHQKCLRCLNQEENKPLFILGGCFGGGETTCKNGPCHPGVILSCSVCWGFKVTGTFL